MKPSTVCYVLLAFVTATTAVGQLSGTDPTLNLSGLDFRVAHADGNRLFLSVTGAPPSFVALMRQQPVPLRKRNPPERERKIQVLFGKDILGQAQPSRIALGKLTDMTTNAPGVKIMSAVLEFDTVEQAEKAAALCRLPEAIPKPLPQ